MFEKLHKLALVFAAGALLCSCGGDDPAGPEEIDNAPKTVTLGSTAVPVKASGGTFTLSVTSPSRPTFSSDQTWAKIADGTFANYKMTVTVSVDKNTSYEERKAVLTFKSGSLSAVCTITQEAAEKQSAPDPDPDPDPEVELKTTLATSGATDAANKLFKYLLSVYGEKTISSVMADVNWNHKLADQIASLTGKYPAMNCYDFIHIYVPKNNWIDYSDITPVTEWAQAGGIVSLMWHFNVPLKEGQTIGTDGSGVTCSPGQTTFRAANALKSGTWENKWFYSEMDKVVAVLLRLQEAGIAAIWRPFHEAAGNATLKQSASWAASWFWWGYDGAETYKKLWVAMFDYFASKGVKNLIWVWTTQNYNGNSSLYNQDTDWYPGDAYVDIIGRDLYGETAAANATEFKEIQAAYPTKMVVLAECGSSVDGSKTTAFAGVPELWNAGAKWGWFMPWYGSNFPADSWWKSAMGSSNVITRDKVSY